MLHGGTELVLAQPQRLLDMDAFGDELREENQPSDGAVRFVPGAGLPLHPFHRAVAARDRVALALLGRPGQDVVIDFLPAVGQTGKHLLVGQSGDVRPSKP
jgi:hypothetical protein